MLGLVIGLGPVIWLAQRGPETGAVTNAAPPEELVWPFCAPDVGPPVYETLPNSALQAGRLFEPVSAAIVPLKSLPEELVQVYEPGFEGIEIGVVKIGSPVFDSGEIADLGQLSEVEVAAHRELWASARSTWLGEDALYLAIDASWDDGTLSAAFVIDAEGRRILSPVWGTAPFPPLDDFAAAELVARPGLQYLDLILEWNESASGSRHPALLERWQTYLDNRYGLGVTWPAPGTPEFWNSAPETCRSLLDAPEAVVDELTPVLVEIEIPEAILGASDAVICLRLDGVGSAGCSALDASGSNVISMNGWTDGIGLLRVQLARSEKEATSWIERVDLAVIEPEDLIAARGARVTIASTTAGSTFDEIVRSVERGEPATVGPLGS